LISVALPLAVPAAANHGTCVLDLSPETDQNALGEPHTITATLRPAGTDPNTTSTATCTTREGGKIEVDLEVTGDSGATYDPGAIDAASTPGAPDLSCSINPNATSCTVTYTRTAVTGTDTIVGFFTAHGTAGQTDTVTKTWVAPSATRLDCNPETDTNPTGTAHAITCTATNNFQVVAGMQIDVEATGTNDPDNAQSFDSPDFTCTTNNEGVCTITHGPGGVGATTAVGSTTYRAWIDLDQNNATGGPDVTEGQAEATTPGATAEADITDVVTKTWTTGPAFLSITPTSDSAEVGTCNAFTVTATDSAGQQVAGFTVDVEQTHSLATNNVANDEPTVSFCTPTSGANPSEVDERTGDLKENPDNRGTVGGETTTATNSAGQVTFGIRVAPGGGSDGTGTVTVAVFYETTDNDDPDQGEPQATATKTWTSTPPPPSRCPGFENDPRNQIVGTEGDDVLEGTNGPDIICGLGGNDTISGLDGDDVLIGGAGNDTITGGEGNDVLRGGPGSDMLSGEGGDDILRGGRGGDVLSGGPGNDHLIGGAGRDVLKGDSGIDILSGGPGGDILLGGPGDDHCKGGGGRDSRRGC